MRIAYFGASAPALHAALLTSHALTGGPDAAATVNGVEDLGRLISKTSDGDLFVAVPSETLCNEAWHSTVDLCVVVGHAADPARSETLAGHHRPTWRLPCFPARIDRTSASDHDLPLALPRLSALQAARLSQPDLPRWLERIAAVLGASVVLAALDPFAPGLVRSCLRDVFEAQTASEILARDRLHRLAMMLPDHAPEVRPRSSARRDLRSVRSPCWRPVPSDVVRPYRRLAVSA